MKYILSTSDIINKIANPTKHLMAVLLLTVAVSASAQIRPADNGEIQTLPLGSLQTDTYYARQNGMEEGIDNLNTTLRYGIAKNYELQMSWASQRRNLPTNIVANDGTAIALKMYLNKESKWLPTTALSIGTSLTIHPDESPLNPFLNLVYEKSITASWRVNGNAQISLNEQDGDIQNGYSANIEADVTSWLTSYIGIVGTTHTIHGNEGTYQKYIEIGSLIWVSNRFTIYPFYDFAIHNGIYGDVLNVGVLYRIH